MFHRDSGNTSDFVYTHFTIWFILAFQAGAINSGGFIACHRFVSHVTGFATHFGTEFAGGHWGEAFSMLSVPMFFLVGSMISGFLIDHRILTDRKPNYTFPFFYMATILLAVSLAGRTGVFGTFGDQIQSGNDYMLIALLCLCCGLQNAMITTVSGAVVRTTHLTGLTTDLGIGLVRAYSSLMSKKSIRQEIKHNWLRAGTILSFAVGSTFGAYGFFTFQYLGFLMPALISSGLCVYSLLVNIHRSQSRGAHHS